MFGAIAGLVGGAIGVAIALAVGSYDPRHLLGGFALGATLGYVGVIFAAWARARVVANRLIATVCPETGEQVLVRVDPQAAGRATIGEAPQHVVYCSRLGGRPTCSQACASQIRL
ncbi:MAG: hypothetical protein KC503_16375 [Myxococcales bacterium]|nr:hypothetical protein [Myxococcales bacterium]